MFQITITIPSAVGGVPGTFQYHRAGKVFACISAAAGFKIRPDNEQAVNMATGRGFGNAASATYNKLSFENSGGASIDVTFYWGFEDYRPDPSQVSANVNVAAIQQNNATYANGKAAAISNLVSGASDGPYPGVIGADIRKQFIVTNANRPVLDPSATDPDTLWVLGKNGNILGIVYPQQSFTFESGDNITVKNPGPNAVNYTVGEVFYKLS